MSPRINMGTGRLGTAVHHFSELPSTNLYLHGIADRFPDGIVVMADHQVAGRGRLGRKWVDAAGVSLLFSVGIIPKIEAKNSSWLTMLAGNAVIEAIDAPLRLKWPNDIVYENKSEKGDGWHKVGGILVEAGFDEETVAYAIVGIGINCNMRLDQLEAITPHLRQNHLRPTSLHAITGEDIDRLALLKRIVDRLEVGLVAAENGQSPHEAWEQNLAGIGRDVLVGKEVGRFVGVDEYGSLLLEKESGTVAIPSGEFSLTFDHNVL